jgi:hypothetical protein
MKDMKEENNISGKRNVQLLMLRASSGTTLAR